MREIRIFALRYTFTPCILLLIAATVTTAIVSATSVVTASMLAFTVVVVVMIAFDLGIKIQFIREQGIHGFVTRTSNAAKELDARVCKSHLRAAANTAADKNRNVLRRKESCKRTMPAAVCINDLG